jgi:two-component system, cell cycle sensor histidine kinase and response regulator CckA
MQLVGVSKKKTKHCPKCEITRWPPTEEVVEEISRGHETILIVEDEDVVRKLAVKVLKEQGYKVLETPEGEKAFMLYEAYKEPIHLILTDVVMPGMSGRKLEFKS